MSGESFLSRWSKRKRAAKAGRDAPAADAVPAPAGARGSLPPVASVSDTKAPVEAPPAPAPLPDVESLTPESDFTPFMRADVDPKTKAQALKTLFGDPRFNVMDGLDVYIDDYSKPDPLPEGWLEKLEQVKHLGIFREEPDEGAQKVAQAEQSAATPPAEPQRLEPATGAPDAAAQSPITPENVRNPDPSRG